MKKYIALGAKERGDIVKAFGVTTRTVRSALGYDPKFGYSDKARRIREMARKQGGELRYDVSAWEVWFDSEGNLRQDFSNGAEIIIEKCTGEAKLYHRGRLAFFVKNIKVSEIPALQEFARSLK